MSRDTTVRDLDASTSRAGGTRRTGKVRQSRNIQRKIPERRMRGDS